MGKQHFQARLLQAICELGEIKSLHDFSINLPKPYEVINGVKIKKQGTANGTLKCRARFLLPLLVKAALGGSFDQAKPFEFINVTIPDDNGGVPIVYTLESVSVWLPEGMSWSRIEGSDDIFDFPIDVAGQVYINGIKVYEDLEEGGL